MPTVHAGTNQKKPETTQSTIQTGPTPRFFGSPSEFRDWLSRHHAKQSALWVGFQKKKSGTPGITYPQALDA
ncbi:MAG TPA: hypothetical protein VHS80_11390, partial [Chthoniobacterales bacterium]|nr:hypothetical protein [Chthoniobacterales bacterium]